MNEKGLLFVLSGFSGAGKGTIMKRFFEQYDGYALSVSGTTRPPREGEIDGVHYHFLTKEIFEDWIEKGLLIEYTKYQDNYYGTPKQFVLDTLNAGTDVFLEIEVDGAGKIRKQFPDAVTVFVTTPTPEELEKRLRMRGSNTEEEIRGRLLRAKEECAFIPTYDYLLINDDLAECVETLHTITKIEHLKEGRQRAFYKAFEEKLSDRVKGEPKL